MIGTVRWNFIVGLTGMVLTTLFSLSHNLFFTSLLRGFYSFIILFIVVFFLRWLLEVIWGLNSMELDTSSHSEDDQHIGSHVDLSTPDENAVDTSSAKNDSISKKENFEPLNPPKLASTNEMDPEEMVKAIRQMSDD